MLGRLVRDHGLGIAVDTGNPNDLATAIAGMITQNPQTLVDAKSAAAFVSQRTPETFASHVYTSLRGA